MVESTTEKTKRRVVLRAILCTLASRIYFESADGFGKPIPGEEATDEALRRAMVRKFRSLLSELEFGLTALGYEVEVEFYTDIIDSDYELSVSGVNCEDRAEVDKLEAAFHGEFGEFLATLPDLLTQMA